MFGSGDLKSDNEPERIMEPWWFAFPRGQNLGTCLAEYFIRFQEDFEIFEENLAEID